MPLMRLADAIEQHVHDGQSVALEGFTRSEEHTSELQSQSNLVCRLLLEKKKSDDVVLADSRRVEGGGGRVDQQVLGALVPVLAELTAPDADGGDSISDAPACTLLPSFAL